MNDYKQKGRTSCPSFFLIKNLAALTYRWENAPQGGVTPTWSAAPSRQDTRVLPYKISLWGGTHVYRPIPHVLLSTVIAKPVTDVTGAAIRNTCPIRSPVSALPPAAPFLSAAKEREERTPPKPRFWNPSAAKVPTALVSFCPANRNKKFRALLSYGLCAYIRWPLTRTRAGLVGRGQIVRLSYSTRRHFLPRFCRGRPPERPETDLHCISCNVSLRGRSAPAAIRIPLAPTPPRAPG